MDVYVLWPRCSWTRSSAVSMVEKIHHKDAIGNILILCICTSHSTKSLHVENCIFTFLSIYCQIVYFLGKNSLRDFDKVMEDNCLGGFFILRWRNVYNDNIYLHHFIFRRNSGWLWSTQDITWWPSVNFPRDLTMPFLYMLLRWLPCFLIFMSKHIPKSRPKAVNDDDFRDFLVSIYYIYYEEQEKEESRKYMWMCKRKSVFVIYYPYSFSLSPLSLSQTSKDPLKYFL